MPSAMKQLLQRGLCGGSQHPLCSSAQLGNLSDLCRCNTLVLLPVQGSAGPSRSGGSCWGTLSMT